MKESKYNFFIPYNDTTIIFNPLYGTIGKLENDVVSRYKDKLLTEKELEVFRKKNILIDDDANELDIINKGRIHGIENPESKLFRVWTTTGCNARCYYCFEKGMKAEMMSEQTAHDAVNYIKSKLVPGDKVTLEWFGGEPLLNVKAMDIISNEVMEYASNNDIKFRGYIITNGSLITKEIADKFVKYKIDSAQITLDGTSDIYNSAKNYYSKDYNFDLVISNIKLLLDNKITVSVRLNYDTNNYESLKDLIIYLHDEFGDNKYFKAYVYPLWSSTNNIEDKFVSTSSADENFLDLVDMLVNYKLMNPKRVIGLRFKKSQCYARNINSCSILPNGDILKCAEVFNQVIGNIYDGITDTDTYNKWTTHELHDECKDCKYLPLCNDGCMGSRFNNMETCIPTKDITEELVKWYVEYLDKTNEKSTKY